MQPETPENIDARYDRSVRIVSMVKWLTIVLIVFVLYRWMYPYRAFDSEAWKQGNDRTRLGMAKYLVHNQTLVGKNKAEVIQLLGQPYGRKAAGFQLSWYAGAGGSLFTSDTYLNIRLDKTDTVVECILTEN